jgi:Skp family chaperone for outer membrane proteins
MWYDGGMDSALPPRYVNVPTREVYDSDLSDGVFRTLAQIRGLAYRFNGARTPPLTLDDLAAIRGVARSTVWKHTTELRERGIIQTEPAERNAFVIHLLPGRPHQADQVEGEATPTGDRDDGSAATADKHLAAEFPLRWGLGAALPVVERADAGQADYKGLPRSDRDRHSRPGMQAAGVHAGAAYQPANLYASGPPDPPRLKGRRRRIKAASRTLKNEMQHFADEIQHFKNEMRASHVVVVKDHDSKQEEDLKQQQHECALRDKESDFGGELQALAEVLVEHGMQADEAQRRARSLLEAYGADVCARQRQVFERRCELARASQRGLDNPVGLLRASIEGDWSLPPAQNERKTARWYTDEEFETFFEH